MILGVRVAIEEAPDERDQRDALQFGAALRVRHVLRRADHGLEPVGIAQGLRSQRGDDLAEADVAVGECVALALGAEEDRADDRPAPADRYHDDRADVAEVERLLHAGQRRVVRGIGDEHRLARFERALELRVPVEVDDEVPDARVLVACDQPDLFVLAGQEDGAAIEAECLAELARDGLQDVDEVQRRGNLLQDVDDRDQVVTFTLELGYPCFQASDLPTRCLVRLAR